jgi:hypothetical protein
MAIPNRIARLNPNGDTNTSFSPSAGLDAEGLCINLDAEGRVVAGGAFNMVGDFLRAKLAFFKPNGELIGSTPTPSDTVRTLATQTSGEILLGGDFTTVNGMPRSRIARILPDLSLEAGFNPNALGPVYAFALQTDGEILVGGNFNTIGGLPRNDVARLFNGLAPNRLYAPSADLIKWDRAGTSEKTQRVTFELDTGSGYAPLAGTISQIATGWQIIPSTPLSGVTNNVRATAFPSDSHSSGTHQIIASFPILPEIVVTIDGKPMTDNVSTVEFPTLQVGATSTAKVIISNIGLATLTLTAPVDVTGQWEIDLQPDITAIAPETSVSFNIRFKPADKGVQLGTLYIFSNDPDEYTFTVNLSGKATEGPGGLDLAWQPNANNQVFTLAKSSDNKVWLGGSFTTVKVLSRQRLALVNIPLADENGNTEEVTVQKQAANIIPMTFVSGFSVGWVRFIAQLPDGTALVSGNFNNLLYWVGFSSNGEVIRKASFTLLSNPSYPGQSPAAICMAVQADGHVLVGGSFGGITIGNSTKRGSLIRILFLPDSKGTIVASIDQNFSAGLTAEMVTGIAIQTDGKIVLTYEANITPARSKVIRLQSDDGALDATFSSPTIYGMENVSLDAQGRVLVQGNFANIDNLPFHGLLRLSSLGGIDPTFERIRAFILTFLPMVDGTLVVSSSDNGGISPCLQKFLPDGTPDTSFISTITGEVDALCSQDDGSLLIGGRFKAGLISLTAARVVNSPASTSLTVVDATKVQLLRSGALPETQIVVFDVSQNNGATWARLGQGKRIDGGWELKNIILPFSGILRARAYIQSPNSSSIMENKVSFSGLEVSDLIVQVPNNNLENIIVPDEGTAAPIAAGAGSVRRVTINLVNAGRAAMTEVDVTLTATSPAGVGRWEIAAKPNGTISQGVTEQMTVNFKPISTDKGLIPADLAITSSVPGSKKTYLVKLVGAAVTPPASTTGTVTIYPGGEVTFNGSFAANDLSASAYFRYGLASASESTWISTPPMPVSGFTAVQKSQPASGLSVGADYAVRAYITNSINATEPVFGGRALFKAE